MYLPEDAAVRKFKRAVQLAARMTYKGEPLQGPLSIDIVAVYQRPKSLCWKTKPMPREWKSSMPDNDNVEKAVWDALKGITWKDDAQIADNRCRKLIADGSESPHLVVVIKPIVETKNSYEQQGTLF